MKQHVFKPSRIVNGKRVVAKCYSGRYRLSDEDRATQVPLGVTDKQAAISKLREIVRSKELETQGLLAPKIQIETASMPVGELVTEWLRDLRAKGRGDHVRIRGLNIGVLIRECGWKRVRDIRPESFMDWRNRNLAKAPKTLNEYLGAAKAFLNWLVKNGRYPSNPLNCVENVETRGRERRERRTISHEEFLRLLDVADEERAVVYATAYYTGLRRKELVLTLWSDFDLESKPATIAVHSSDTKNKEKTKLPIHSDLAALLIRYRASCGGLSAKGAAFVVPERLRAFNKDLEAAGIPRLDERGRRFDFHSLRHCCATRLAAIGAPLNVAMGLMRHNNPIETAKTYVDQRTLNFSETIEKLSGLNPAEHSPIHSPELVAEGQNESKSVARKSVVEDSQASVTELLSRLLSLFDARGQMAPAVGIEPTT